MIPKDLQIPGYDIEALLGRGGMAAVYRARQQSFGREVALKVLNPEVDDIDEFSRRFLQESVIAAKLHHSHIVQVYDVGQHEHYFYISMEYLHGGDLSNRLQEGLSLRETVRIITQLADALDFAHRKNIIHRDIKPANIMFREDGAAVLTDFGIAKELETQSELTQTGLILGTPKYMSPEHLRGEHVDHRADIYALGIVFYRCLTNYVPFDGKDMVTTAYLQDSEPVPALPPEVACFQGIINRMLEKAPQDRFQRGREVITALEALEKNTYSPDLTNLDVAAANKLAPPTVTRSTSGRHSLSGQQAVSSSGVKIEPRIGSEGTQVHVRTSLNKTIRAEHMKSPLDFLSDRFAPVQQPQSKRKPSLMAIPLFIVFFGVSAIPTNQFSDRDPAQISADVVKAAHELLANIRDVAGSANNRLTNDLSENAENSLQIPLEVAPNTKGVASDSSITAIDASEKTPVSNIEQTEADLIELIEAVVGAFELDGNVEVLAANPPMIGTYFAMSDAEANSGIQNSAAEIANYPNSNDSEVENAIETVPAEETVEPAEPDISAVVAGLLAEADVLRASRRLRKPEGNNAYSKYQKVLEIQPDNTDALAGIEKIADAYISMAQRAIKDKKFDTARIYLDEAHAVAPQREDLERIETQLAFAIEAQHEQEMLAAAERRAAKIEELLTAAKADEEAGRIRSPVGNNALEKYQQVLEMDPDNAQAINKLIEYGR